MKEGKTIGLIFGDPTLGVGKQRIVVYTPNTFVLNNKNNLTPIEKTQTILTQPVVNKDLTATINKLGIKKGDVIVIESDSYKLCSPVLEFRGDSPLNFNFRCEVVFNGVEKNGLSIIHNGTTMPVGVDSINRISVVSGDLQLRML